LKDYIRQRVMEVGEYIARTGATVREAAGEFGVSKSTIHKDVTERLPKLHAEMYQAVRDILDYNKAQRHIRGGEATRKKYQEEDTTPEGAAAQSDTA